MKCAYFCTAKKLIFQTKIFKKMLSKILSVSGRPGLYKLISTNKNLNIVEGLADGKRIPVYAQEKVVALSDVSIYTNDEDAPLREVFTKIKEKENGKQVALGNKSSNKEFFAYLQEVLPDYDKDKVYASDVKKLISWYNILTEHEISFEEEPQTTEEEPAEEAVTDEEKE